MATRRAQRQFKMESAEFRHAYVDAHLRSWVALQVRRLRETRKWSQADLALKMQTKQSVIARLENPDGPSPSLRTLMRAAVAFDVALLCRFISHPRFLDETTDLRAHKLNVRSWAKP